MVCALSGNLIRESERQTAAVAARSAALRVQLQKLTFGILPADAAATNFLLTGKEDALTPFRKANDAAPALIGAIERMCEGHIDELDRIHRISSLSDAALTGYRTCANMPATPKQSLPKPLQRRRTKRCNP